MYKIRKCLSCGNYTLKEKCPVCGKETKIVSKYKFKVEDPYFDIKVKEKYGV